MSWCIGAGQRELVLGGRGGAGRRALGARGQGPRVPGTGPRAYPTSTLGAGPGGGPWAWRGIRRRYLGVGRGPGGGSSACGGGSCAQTAERRLPSRVLPSFPVFGGRHFQPPQLAPALAAALLPGGGEVPHLEVPRHTQVKRMSASGLAYLRRSFRVTDRRTVGFKKGGAHSTRLTLPFPSGPHPKPGGEGGPPSRRLGDSG